LIFGFHGFMYFFSQSAPQITFFINENFNNLKFKGIFLSFAGSMFAFQLQERMNLTISDFKKRW